MFYVSYKQVCRVYRFYGGFSLGEELRETKFDCLSFSTWSFTMEIVKQSSAQILNN